MGIGTLSLEYLEYGQSHLSDGARRSLRRPRWGTMITANGAQTKAEFKRCIARRDRRAFTVELPVVVDDGPDFDAIDEWFDTMNEEQYDDALHAQMLQAYEDDGIAADVPTSSIYGDTVELWDADEWTQLGFSITTLR